MPLGTDGCTWRRLSVARVVYGAELTAAGWPAPRTIGYKEIYGMEHEPSFLRYMQRPLFRHVGGRVYGAGRPIAINRAMFFAKPSFVTGDDNPRVAASLNIGFLALPRPSGGYPLCTA